jgi:outer membrane murein-binding lipoprotein Lpp
MAQEEKNPFEEMLIQITQLEMDVKRTKEAQSAASKNLRADLDNFKAEMEKYVLSLQTTNETMIRYSKHIDQLERKVERIRTDSSSGLVVSIIIFAILFIISLVIRA